MSDITVLVLADPPEPQLRLMDALKSDIDIIVGNRADVSEEFATRADVILSWSGSVSLLREVFHSCPHVQWIHTRAAGVEGILSPELIEGSNSYEWNWHFQRFATGVCTGRNPVFCERLSPHDSQSNCPCVGTFRYYADFWPHTRDHRVWRHRSRSCFHRPAYGNEGPRHEATCIAVAQWRRIGRADLQSGSSHRYALAM